MPSIAAAALLFFTLVGLGSAELVNDEYASFPARGADDDLLRYITRPDLTPPRLNVQLHSRDRVAPGYVFLAPYDCLECSHRPTTSYVSQQIGPHIYDQNGDLVWSGIDLFPDRKVFNFQAIALNGSYHLALVAPHEEEWHPFADGAAIIMNASYDVTNILTSDELGARIDLHEFNLLADGRTLLVQSNAQIDIHPRENAEGWRGKGPDNFFTEFDLVSRQINFHWAASKHIPRLESTNPVPSHRGPRGCGPAWDWIHMNSVDKDSRGNYLMSARFMNTLYYISPTGDILWRLGGANSSFTQNFNFSRQHHARIRGSTNASMTISFFDNAADNTGDWEPTAASSSMKIVTLDLVRMVATLNAERARPDKGLTEAKGNVQYLSNGNILASWGENAYLTEFTTRPRGKQLIWEARFASPRFGNYRGYKMDFIGQPRTKPVAKAFATTNYLGDISTTIYVSWNGATEVASWRFYSDSGQGKVYIGSTKRSGFETAFVADGHHLKVFAEAYDRNDNSLAMSTLASTELPPGFNKKSAAASRPPASSGVTHLSAHWLGAFLVGVCTTFFWNQYRSRPPKGEWKPKWLELR